MNMTQNSYRKTATQTPQQWRPALGLALVMLVLCGGIYSATVTSIGGVLFPQQAMGSLIALGDKPIGSALISQPFSAEHYFHGRPSSAGNDPMATGGSNLAPSNPELRDRVAQTSAMLTKQYQVPAEQLPVDLLASSGSGVDPHISPAAALLQLERVAAARKAPVEAIQQLLTKQTEAAQWGIFGQPRVNVLLLNLALDAQHPLQ